jgi:hypothetical protein
LNSHGKALAGDAKLIRARLQIGRGVDAVLVGGNFDGTAGVKVADRDLSAGNDGFLCVCHLAKQRRADGLCPEQARWNKRRYYGNDRGSTKSFTR